jgi:hypothetical protein
MAEHSKSSSLELPHGSKPLRRRLDIGVQSDIGDEVNKDGYGRLAIQQLRAARVE